MKKRYLIIQLSCLFFFIIIVPIVSAFGNWGANGTVVWGTASRPGLLNSTNYSYPRTLGVVAPTGSLSTFPLSPINFTKIVSSSTRQEKVAGIQRGDGSLYFLNCSNTCRSPYDWNIIGNYTRATAVANTAMRSFDLAAFDNGDIMAVFANGTMTNKTYYCIWNGSAWRPEQNCFHATQKGFIPNQTNEINVSGVGVPFWISLAALGNKALLGVSGSSGFSVAYFNGSWQRNMTISALNTRLAVTAQPAFSIAWENETAPGTTNGKNNGLVVFDKTAADGTTFYRRFNGTNDTWDPVDTTGPDTGAGNNLWIELASDPNSRRLSMIIADSETDVHIYIWKLNNFTEGFTTPQAGTTGLDEAIEATTGKIVTTTWSYNRSTALFAYVNANDLNLDVVCWNPMNNFSAINTVAGGANTDDVDRIQAVRSPINNDSIIIRGDIVGDLIMTRWNGSTSCLDADFEKIPSTGVIETTLSVSLINNPQIPFSFAYDWFVPPPSAAPDATPPASSNPAKNETLVYTSQFINFTASWTDAGGLSSYIFSINQSGIWINSSAVSLSGNSGVSTNVTNINATVRTVVQWRFFAKDTSNNWGDTGIQEFVVSNTVPQIIYVNNITTNTPSITEAGSTQFMFNFTVEDADGVGTINTATAFSQLNSTGEAVRSNYTCLAKTNLSSTRTQFECITQIWYFDAPGMWTINASIKDTNGSQAINITSNITIRSTLAMVMGPTSLTWPQVVITSLNTTATNDPVIINNTGNQNVSLANVKVQALDLPGETTPNVFLNASNFTVSGTTGADNPECIGTRLVNNSATGIVGLGMTKGNNTINSYNYSSGQAPLYFCLAEVTVGITQQSYSTRGAAWIISIV